MLRLVLFLHSSISRPETVFVRNSMGMQVGPSVRGFDMDNSSAENAAVIRYTGRISLHARVIYRTGFFVGCSVAKAVLDHVLDHWTNVWQQKECWSTKRVKLTIRKLIR